MTTTDEKIDELARQVEAMTVALERLYGLLSDGGQDHGKDHGEARSRQGGEQEGPGAMRSGLLSPSCDLVPALRSSCPLPSQ